jgi:O-antigen/teichoic acid export membrane protein
MNTKRNTLMPRLAVQPRTAMFVSFAGASALHVIFGLAMGWLLTPGDFGLVMFTQTVLFIAALVLSSGFPTTLAAQLAQADPSDYGRLVRGAAGANICLAIGLGGLLMLLFVLGPFRPGFERPHIAGIVACTLPCFAIIAVARAAAQGLGSFGVMAVLQAVEALAKVIAAAALMMAGFGVAGAIAASLAGALAAASLAIWLLATLLGIRLTGQLARPPLRAAGAMFVALIGLTLLLHTDQLMLKLIGGIDRAQIGQYQAAAVLANAPYQLASAFIPILFTRVAQIGAIGRTGGALRQALRLGLLGIVPLALVLAGVRSPLLHAMFPNATAAGVALVPILTLANCALTFVSILVVPFTATHNPRVPARILSTVLGAEAVALWLVVPSWHTAGAALTFLCATVATLVALAAAYAAHLGARLTSRMLLWAAKYCLALAAGVATCLAVSGGLGNGMLLSIQGGLASYVMLAIALGLIRVPLRPALARVAARQ